MLVLHSFVSEQICRSKEGIIGELGPIVVLISVAIYRHLKDIALVLELNNDHRLSKIYQILSYFHMLHGNFGLLAKFTLDTEHGPMAQVCIKRERCKQFDAVCPLVEERRTHCHFVRGKLQAELVTPWDVLTDVARKVEWKVTIEATVDGIGGQLLICETECWIEKASIIFSPVSSELVAKLTKQFLVEETSLYLEHIVKLMAFESECVF